MCCLVGWWLPDGRRQQFNKYPEIVVVVDELIHQRQRLRVLVTVGDFYDQILPRYCAAGVVRVSMLPSNERQNIPRYGSRRPL